MRSLLVRWSLALVIGSAWSWVMSPAGTGGGHVNFSRR
jgi:hypothetical protein